jgi:hypothetical protein
LRQIGEALRFLEAAQAPDAAIAGDIEHFDRVIAERRDEKALSFDVDREMIDAPPDFGHVDRRDEGERRLGAGRPRSERTEERH